jgi:ribosomal protein S14
MKSNYLNKIMSSYHNKQAVVCQRCGEWYVGYKEDDKINLCRKCKEIIKAKKGA